MVTTPIPVYPHRLPSEVAIALIAAAARNGVIGIDNRLPWRLPEDLRCFKRLTMGKPVVMGRKTWESLGRPLPGRVNIVVSRNPNVRAVGAEVFSDLEAALRRAQALAADTGVPEVMVIGGETIYRQALPLAQRIYLTEVDLSPEGDAWFPPLAPEAWRQMRTDVLTEAPVLAVLRVLERIRAEDDALYATSLPN
jgi:dihydrofolate reductase